MILDIQSKDDEEKRRRQEEAENREFDCPVCLGSYKIKDQCISLNCDHRFCKECVKAHINEQIEKGKMNINELCCPTCLENINVDKNDPEQVDRISVDLYIIKSLIDPENYEKILNFRNHNLISFDKNKKYIYCPGFLEKVVDENHQEIIRILPQDTIKKIINAE